MDQSMSIIEDLPQRSNKTSKRQSQAINQALCIIPLYTALYYFVAYSLTSQISWYWIWALYLSPIFVLTFLFMSGVYVMIAEDQDIKEFFSNDQTTNDANYFAFNILFGITLLMVPTFMVVYFGIFHDIIQLQQKGTHGSLKDHFQIQYQQENYTILLYDFNHEGRNFTGYGCASSHHLANIYELHPKPYSFYTPEQPISNNNVFISQKIPSWLCSATVSNQTSIFYTQIGNPVARQEHLNNFDKDYFLITFQSPAYIPEYSFAILVVILFQMIWIFAGILVYLIVLYMTSSLAFQIEIDTQLNKYDAPTSGITNKERMKNDLVDKQRKQLSGTRRIFLSIFSFCEFCTSLYFTLQIDQSYLNIQYASYAGMVIPGLMLMVFSGFSRTVYKKFACCLRSNSFIVCLIMLLVSPIYLAVTFVACFCITNFVLFYSWIFVAQCKKINEDDLSERQFNSFANKIYLFQQLVRGPMQLIIIAQLNQQISVSLILTSVFCLIQTILGLTTFINLIVKQNCFEFYSILVYEGPIKQKKNLVKIEHELSVIEQK